MYLLTIIFQKMRQIFAFWRKKRADQELLTTAYLLAVKTLRARYLATGIMAGRTHFSDIWIRDSCFASLGALSIGDQAQVKINLSTILKFTSSEGQVPLRIGQKYMLLKFLGFNGQPRARYLEDKTNALPSDSNSLLLIVLEKYLLQSKDWSFAQTHWSCLKKIIEWNFRLDEDHDLLLEEEPYAGWADSLRKRGKVLYSNVLHYQALTSFAQICSNLNKTELAQRYTQIAMQVKKQLNQLFWNGSYYIDWIHKHQHTYFATDGNVLAIIFGLANQQQAEKIQDSLHKFNLDQSFSTDSNYPRYHNRHVFSLFRPCAIGDYHNGLQWLWLGCVDAVAKHKIGHHLEAHALLRRIASKIVEYKGIYEVYFDGKPVNRFFYKSEEGFAWSAGLFIWACHQTGLK